MTALCLIACSLFEKTADFGEEFKLKKGDAVGIRGADLRLRVSGSGHDIVDGGGHALFCRLEVSTRTQKKELVIDVGESARVENFNIRIASADNRTDPKAADPWSTNGCGVVVNKTTE